MLHLKVKISHFRCDGFCMPSHLRCDGIQNPSHLRCDGIQNPSHLRKCLMKKNANLPIQAREGMAFPRLDGKIITFFIRKHKILTVIVQISNKTVTEKILCFVGVTITVQSRNKF